MPMQQMEFAIFCFCESMEDLISEDLGKIFNDKYQEMINWSFEISIKNLQGNDAVTRQRWLENYFLSFREETHMTFQTSKEMCLDNSSKFHEAGGLLAVMNDVATACEIYEQCKLLNRPTQIILFNGRENLLLETVFYFCYFKSFESAERTCKRLYQKQIQYISGLINELREFSWQDDDEIVEKFYWEVRDINLDIISINNGYSFNEHFTRKTIPKNLERDANLRIVKEFSQPPNAIKILIHSYYTCNIVEIKNTTKNK